MRVVLEVPDDTPAEQVESLRDAAESGMWIVLRRPAHLSNESVANFVAVAGVALAKEDERAAEAGAPEVQPSWRETPTAAREVGVVGSAPL